MCVVIFLLCTVQVCAAENTDVKSPDIELLKTLGVFPADISEGQPLTRNDLARIYFSIMMPSMANEEYVPMQQSKFTDIGDEHFAANFVTQLKIMEGTDENTFEPDGTLSYTQLVKTVISFLGYRDMAISYGGYPNGYLKCALSLGLGKYADYGDNIVTTDVAAAIFMAAADVKVAENIYSPNKTVTLRGNDKNYLEQYLNIYEKDGIVSANYIENIYEKGKTTDFHYINIGEEMFLLSDATLPLRRKIGYNVAAYVKYTSNNEYGQVLCFKERKNSVYEVSSQDVIGYERESSLFMYFDDRTRKRSFDIKEAYVMYNGVLEQTYDESILNPFSDKTLDGSVSLIDNDADGRIDVVSVIAYKSYVVTKIVDGKIYNKYHPSEIFDISKISERKTAITNVLGNTIELNKIENGDIISVFLDARGKISEICVSMDTYVGNLKQIERTNERLEKIKIDSMEYDFANMYAVENKDTKELRTDSKVKVYFDFSGKICEIEKDDYSKERYGYLVGLACDNTLKNSYKIKIFTATSEFLIADLGAKVRINQQLTKVQEVKNILGTAPDGKSLKRQLVRYIYDKDKNVVTDISTVDDDIDETQDGFYKYKNITSEDTNHFRAQSKSFNAKLLLSGSSIVFIIPSEANRDNDECYSAQDASFFPDANNSLPIEAYGTKAHNPVAEVLVVEPKSGDGIMRSSKKSQYMIVKKSGVKRDADGEYLNYASGFMNGYEVEFVFKSDEYFYINDGEPPRCGDIIYIGFDKDSKISASEFICSSKDKKLASAFTQNPSAELFTNGRYLIGSVLYFDDISMKLEIKDYPPSTKVTVESYPATGIKIYEYIEDGKNSRVTLADPSVIHDSVHNGTPAQVFVYTYGSVPQFAVVYHE